MRSPSRVSALPVQRAVNTKTPSSPHAKVYFANLPGGGVVKPSGAVILVLQEKTGRRLRSLLSWR